MRSATLSLYTLATSLSTSALRFSALLSSAVCFSQSWLFSCLQPSEAVVGAVLRQAVPVFLNVEYGAERRCKMCHSGYSAWYTTLALARSYCNGNSHKESYSDDPLHKPMTSHSQYTLQALRISWSFHLLFFCGVQQCVPRYAQKHLLK